MSFDKKFIDSRCVILVVRMLVYEYVDNGNLDQWLHGDVGEVSPLTWGIRMNIILGTAKGYDTSLSPIPHLLRNTRWDL